MLGETKQARDPARRKAAPARNGEWASRTTTAFPALAGPIAAADARLELRDDADAIAGWRDVANRLFEANLGAQPLETFFDLSRVWPDTGSLDALIAIAQSAAHAGRHCGSAAAGRFLRQWWQIAHHSKLAFEVEGYCLAFDRLVEASPECLDVLIPHLPPLVERMDGNRFFTWVHAGLRAHARDRAKRLAFFDLKDEFALQLLSRESADSDFVRLERRLRCGLLALWGENRQLAPLDTKPVGFPLARRASMAGGILRFPDSYPGFSETRADTLFRAAVAHAGAHYRYSTQKFPIKTLRPVQVALVSLIEDARVEALAIQDYPGLALLWRAFYADIRPDNTGVTATGLMMRLARALLDPDYADDNSWVIRGRDLFNAARDCLHHQQISREIGGLLGNDFGQTRLQFNIKTYVVQPSYRDDNIALWDFGDQPGAPQDTIELLMDSVSVRSGEAGGAPEPSPDSGEPTSRPRAAVMRRMDGAEIASYPEWDYAMGSEHPNWVTVRHNQVQPAAARCLPDSEDGIAAKILRITRGMPVGQRVRRKRLLDGEIIDLDAAIDSVLAKKMKQAPNERIFQRSAAGQRDLAALLLLDLSQSTADLGEEGRTVLSLELEAAFAIGRAMDAAGDALAIDGFCSDGRANVYYATLKEFDEPFSDRVAARLAGTTSGYSTRLGAALRHAATRLKHARTFRRILLVLTDGEPSDIDVTDPLYLREDARRAVHAARRESIDAFAFGIGAHASSALGGIFGHQRTLYVPRAAVLPRRLVQLYEELKK